MNEQIDALPEQTPMPSLNQAVEHYLESRRKPETKLTGGRVSYYFANVAYPQREDQPPYRAECEDISEALELTPDEFDVFKAIWRSAAARLGNEKPGHKAIYDAEKMVHKSGRILRRLKRTVGNAEAQN